MLHSGLRGESHIVGILLLPTVLLVFLVDTSCVVLVFFPSLVISGWEAVRWTYFYPFSMGASLPTWPIDLRPFFLSWDPLQNEFLEVVFYLGQAREVLGHLIDFCFISPTCLVYHQL